MQAVPVSGEPVRHTSCPCAPESMSDPAALGSPFPSNTLLWSSLLLCSVNSSEELNSVLLQYIWYMLIILFFFFCILYLLKVFPSLYACLQITQNTSFCFLRCSSLKSISQYMNKRKVE